jgi:uncharacterized membrane protein
MQDRERTRGVAIACNAATLSPDPKDPMTPRNILLAGETWISHKIDTKGFSAYSVGSYGEGQTEFVAALREAGHTVTHVPNHTAVQEFPWDVEATSAYDVVILSDISADTLQIHPDGFDRGQRVPDRMEVLGEYVRGGGGLLMVGGYMSFSGLEGKAHYEMTALADVLPVGMLGRDDRVERPAGVVPKVELDHEVLAGIDGEWPWFLGYNRLLPKDTGDVLMTIGGDPFLVVGEHGKGRVGAFASDCSPHWGTPEFLAWEHYGRLWGQLLGWLGGAR